MCICNPAIKKPICKDCPNQHVVDEIKKTERKRIADAMYEFQRTVTMFATTNECVAYNKALRDFADQIDSV